MRKSIITGKREYTTNFCEKPINDLFEFLKKPTDQWVYRGQLYQYRLDSTLERACSRQCLDLKESAKKVESETVRQFRRSYEGNDKEDVRENTLYCLSLMRHYGAPTRLLDWTYSRYVAAYFALESAMNQPLEEPERKCAIWAINGKWLEDEAKSSAGEEVRQRGLDQVRSDPSLHEKSFKVLYLDNQFSLVLPENPYYFHQRLQIQQAVHLCPGNVTIGFEDNLKHMNNWDEEISIIKYVYETSLKQVVDDVETLLKMNVSRRTLFPGLSGLAESLQYPLKFYEKLSGWHDGT